MNPILPCSYERYFRFEGGAICIDEKNPLLWILGIFLITVIYFTYKAIKKITRK